MRIVLVFFALAAVTAAADVNKTKDYKKMLDGLEREIDEKAEAAVDALMDAKINKLKAAVNAVDAAVAEIDEHKMKKSPVPPFVECTSNTDCGGNTPICEGGVCVACTASAECVNTAGPTCCPASGACVNWATDAANCGSCGTVCGATQTCSFGVCVDAGTTLCTGKVPSKDQQGCGVCSADGDCKSADVCTTYYGMGTQTCNAKASSPPDQAGCSGAGVKCCLPTKPGVGNQPPSVVYEQGTGLCTATTPAG